MRMLGVVFAVVVAVAPAARAQNFAEAGKHFQAAQDAFGKKHFRIAADEFQKAFDIAGDPVLLYNVAEAWERSGHGHKAVDAYKAYLKAKPKAEDRGEVTKRIRSITKKRFHLANQSSPGDEPVRVAEVKPAAPPVATTPPRERVATPPPRERVATTTPPPREKMMTPDFLKEEPTPPAREPAQLPMKSVFDLPVTPSGEGTPPPKSNLLRTLGFVGVGVTVALAAGGVTCALLAQQRADDISRRFADASAKAQTFDAQQQRDYKNLRDQGKLLNGLGIGLLAGAGVAAVGTVVLFVVHAKRNKQPPARAYQLVPTASREGAGIVFDWSF